RYESPWIWMRVGLAIGLLAATKVIGILVLGFIVVVTLVVLITIPTTRLRINRAFFHSLLKTTTSAVIGCVICFSVFWPQFFFWNPINIVNIAWQFMSYKNWHGNVLVHGKYFSADNVPWFYLLTYFSISMPLFLLALAGAGVVSALFRREALI